MGNHSRPAKPSLELRGPAVLSVVHFSLAIWVFSWCLQNKQRTKSTYTLFKKNKIIYYYYF